jgi:hypothetical protein
MSMDNVQVTTDDGGSFLNSARAFVKTDGIKYVVAGLFLLLVGILMIVFVFVQRIVTSIRNLKIVYIILGVLVLLVGIALMINAFTAFRSASAMTGPQTIVKRVPMNMNTGPVTMMGASNGQGPMMMMNNTPSGTQITVDAPQGEGYSLRAQEGINKVNFTTNGQVNQQPVGIQNAPVPVVVPGGPNISPTGGDMYGRRHMYPGMYPNGMYYNGMWNGGYRSGGGATTTNVPPRLISSNPIHNPRLYSNHNGGR